MKWFIRVLGILGILFLLFLIIQIFMPAQMNVTAEKEYEQSSEQVYQAFANTEKFNSFNQWMKIDPENTKVVYSEVKRGKGAHYTWSNEVNVDEVGSGSLDIVEATPNSLVKYEMRFDDDPTPGIGTITISEKKGKTKVIWNFLGTKTPFMFRFFNKVFHGMVFNNMSQSLMNLEKLLKNTPKSKITEEDETYDLELITCKDSTPLSIELQATLIKFPQEKKVIALFQETSTDDMQEITMAFQESMGVLYSYLRDDQGLKAGQDFSYPVGIYKEWNEEKKIAQFYVGFILNKEVPKGEGMEVVTIPASEHMIKKIHQGPYNETGEVHRKINEFIQKEKIEITGNPFEIYKSEPSTPDDQKVTEIYYPVKYNLK